MCYSATRSAVQLCFHARVSCRFSHVTRFLQLLFSDAPPRHSSAGCIAFCASSAVRVPVLAAEVATAATTREDLSFTSGGLW